MLSELWSDLRYRARAVFRRGAVDRELADEMRAHLEHEVDKLMKSGVPRDEAHRRARLQFGGVERIKDDTRDAHGIAFVDTLSRDLRYAIRGLRIRPGFTAAVVLTLGLGVGVNAAMFGVLDRLLLRPPSYVIDASRVNRVYIGSMDRGKFHYDGQLEYPRYLDFVRWTNAFDAHTAFDYRELAIGEGAELAPRIVGVVSATYFNFFNARPVIGRFFTASEDMTPRGAAVVVLTRDYWESQYGGRSDVIGSAMKIDGENYTIVGVAPKGFTGFSDQLTPIAFVPLTTFAARMSADFYQNYGWSWLNLIVRRKPGVSVDAATADLTNAYRRSWMAEALRSHDVSPIEAAQPRAFAGDIALGRGPTAGPEARVVMWMSGVALMVLLIACANVANLLLVRSLRRRRELAVRYALGGSRSRIIRQLFTETFVLALLGGMVGVVAAQMGGGVLRREFLQSNEAGVIADPRTLVFALLVTLGAALVAGLVPAFQQDRTRTADSLKAGSRESSYSHSRARSSLLVIQAAVSVVLLIGAGLFVRSLREVRALRLGYDVDPLVVVSISGRGMNPSPEEREALMQRVSDETRATPGVANLTRAVTVPFYNTEGRSLYVDGIDSVRKLGRFTLQIASPEYFATVGTKILRGRGITAEDRANAPAVAVVSEAMGRVLWRGADPIGKCIRVRFNKPPCRTVVGIAENIRGRSFTGDAEFHYYLPSTQIETEQLFIARVNGAGSDFAEALRKRLQPLMPGSAYINVMPMSKIMEPRMRSWRFGAATFAAFGVLALVLAAIGLYAVVAFAVAQRRHEIGLRIALGAQTRDVLRLVIGEGIGVALVGIAIGFVISLAAGPRVSSLLYHVSPRDPLTYVVVGMLLIAVAAVASAVPAMRATRVDPNVALRTE